MKPISVLFTSAGRRVELLKLFGRARGELGLDCTLIATDIDPLAPTMRFVDKGYIIPRTGAPGWIEALKVIVERHRPMLIFPLIDPDIPLLAKHRQELEQFGSRLVVIPSDKVEICADKIRTIEFFRSIGVKAPKSWTADTIRKESVEYPLYIRPRGGSAGRHAYRVADRDELNYWLARVHNPIVQEFLPGPEITTDVIADLQGTVHAAVNRQRIETRSGEVSQGVTIYDERIVDATVRIANALDIIGTINIQCLMKDDEPHFTEVNPRFGGGLPLGIAAGANAPKWLLAEAAELTISYPGIGDYIRGLYLTRCDTSYFTKKEMLDGLERVHL